MEPPPPKRPRFLFHPPPPPSYMIPPVPDVPSPISTTVLPPLPPPAIDPNVVFYKTRLCHTFSTKGSCPYDHLCRFAHGPVDLREPVPNWQVIAETHRTKVCRNYAAGACPYGDRCLYSHARGGGSAARPTVPAAPVGGNASRCSNSSPRVSAHGSAVLKQKTTPAVSVAEAVKDSVEAATVSSSTLPTSANSPIHVGTGTPPNSQPTQQRFPKLRGIKKLNHIYADWID